MDSIKLCNMACTNGKNVQIPNPGVCQPTDFKFHTDKDRALYIAMIGNTQGNSLPKTSYKVAIVGLSPADTQLKMFTNEFNRTSSYENAALEAAFKGLSSDIIKMLNGLGVGNKIGIGKLSETTDLNRCGIFLTTSLVKCASLTLDGDSSDFDPWKYDSNVRCITKRFVPEILSYEKLTHLLVFGSKAKRTLTEKGLIDGDSVHNYLEKRGKKIAYLPHPSGANRESVDLASLDEKDFPSLTEYQDKMWEKYKLSKSEKEGKLSNEWSYKKTRKSRWASINEIREIFKS